MFTCENCSKEYVSQKRYQTHVNKCEGDTISIASSMSESADLDVSDVESSISTSSQTRKEKGTSRVRDMVEKLMKDNTKLKSELKKYSTELKSVYSTHQDELEKNQEYFQEQINSIAEERDNLSEQVMNYKENIFKEKENLRSEFAKKIATEKKRLESKYKDRSPNEYTDLNNIIGALKSNLKQKLEEIEILKNDFEFQLSEKDDLYKKQIDELRLQITETKNSVQDERIEFRKILMRCKNEKEILKVNCERDKEKQLEHFLIEKRMAAKASEQLKLEFETKIAEMKKDREKAITDLQYENQTILREKKEQLVTLKKYFAEQMENQNNILTGKLNNALRDFNTERQKYIHTMEDKIKGISIRHDTILESEISQREKKISVLQNTAEREKNRADIAEKKIVEDLLKKEKELTLFYENKIQSMTDEMQRSEKKYLNDINTETTKRDIKIADLEKVNENLTRQTKYYKEALSNIQDDTNNIKNKLIENLNTQKELHNLSLRERDSRISELENNLKLIHEECSEKLLKAKSKMEDVESENKIKSIKISENEKSLEKFTDIVKQLKLRIEELKEEFKTKIQTVQDISDLQFKEELKIKTAKIEELNITVTDLKRRFSEQLKLFKDEKNNYEISIKMEQENKNQSQINILTKQIEDINKEFTNKLNTQNANMSSEIENLKQQVEEKSQELVSKNKEIETLKQTSENKITELLYKVNIRNDSLISEIDTLKKALNDKTEELIIVKTTLDKAKLDKRIDENNE